MLFTNSGHQNEIIQGLAIVILFITLPVNFLGFGIMYGDAQEGIPLALIVQLVVFFGFWFIVFRFLLKNYRKKLVQEEYKDLKRIFQEMANDNFEFSNALSWTYSFIDSNKELLELISIKLKEANYNSSSVVQNNEGKWTLQVLRKEILTPVKLAKRNIAFLELAEKYKVEAYLGWNVEKQTHTTHNS